MGNFFKQLGRVFKWIWRTSWKIFGTLLTVVIVIAVIRVIVLVAVVSVRYAVVITPEQILQRVWLFPFGEAVGALFKVARDIFMIPLSLIGEIFGLTRDTAKWWDLILVNLKEFWVAFSHVAP